MFYFELNTKKGINMKISSISNSINSIVKKTFPNNSIKENKQNNNVSFKAIYVEDIVDLGDASAGRFPTKFLTSDALLLEEISMQYPYQDCFILAGRAKMPRLEYRERPVGIQLCSTSIFKPPYTVSIDPEDSEYPTEPLILYDNSRLNRMIGVPSYISLNPSLPFTVKAGYDLHKKLIEKKYQIKEALGRSDEVDLGEESLIKKAHKAIEDVESAVTRYLLSSAYTALTDRASAKQIYESDYPKVQSRLDAKRKLDLTTSIAKQPQLSEEDLKDKKIDICDIAMKLYPNMQENKAEIKKLEEYMARNGIIIS